MSKVTVDFIRAAVYADGERLDLTAIQYKLLCLLVSQPGQALSSEYLLRNVWGQEYSTRDIVKWHVSNLRKKLGSKESRRISTIHGFGYKWVCDPDEVRNNGGDELNNPLAVPAEIAGELQLERLKDLRTWVLGSSDLNEIHDQYSRLSGLEAALRKYRDAASETVVEVACLRLETERHMGALLRQVPRRPGTRTDLPGGPTSSDDQTRLYGLVVEDLGVSRDTAMRWQWLTYIPEDVFGVLLQAARDTLTPPTRTYLESRVRPYVEKERQRRATEEAQDVIWQAKDRLALSLPEARDLSRKTARDMGVNKRQWPDLVRAVTAMYQESHPDQVLAERELWRDMGWTEEPHPDDAEAERMAWQFLEGGAVRPPTDNTGHNIPAAVVQASALMMAIKTIEKRRVPPEQFAGFVRGIRDAELWPERVEKAQRWLARVREALGQAPPWP